MPTRAATISPACASPNHCEAQRTMPTRTPDTALRQALGLRLEQWRARLQADAPDAAIWTEVIDTTRGELRLLAPRQAAHRIRKKLQQKGGQA